MAIEYRPFAYISPSGTRMEFTYNGELSDEQTHNLGAFNFSNTDGSYYQDRSITTGVYPFVIKLEDQEDLRELRELLSEKASPGSPGILEHPDPTLGSFPVVVSSSKVDQKVIRGRGVIDVTVQFFRQIPDLIAGDPATANNPASAAATAESIDELNTDQAADLEGAVDLSTGAAFAAFVRSAIDVANAAKDKLQDIASKVDAINTQFTNLYAEIISTADELARAPFTLARKLQNLIQLPMAAIDSVQDRIAAYKEMVNDVLGISESEQTEIDSGSPAGKNILATKGLGSLAGVSAITFSAVSGKSVNIGQISGGSQEVELVETGNLSIQSGYLSRPQIINVINDVQEVSKDTTDQLSDLSENFGAEIFFSQYFDYSILNKTLLTTALINLNSRIYSAKQEKKIITGKEENIIPLCARLYNSVELSTISFFIESNQLHGDELYLIPKGREILYYE